MKDIIFKTLNQLEDLQLNCRKRTMNKLIHSDSLERGMSIAYNTCIYLLKQNIDEHMCKSLAEAGYF